MWWRPEPSSVSPIYMPGRLRTASRPFSTLIDSAPYSAAAAALRLEAGVMVPWRRLLVLLAALSHLGELGPDLTPIHRENLGVLCHRGEQFPVGPGHPGLGAEAQDFAKKGVAADLVEMGRHLVQKDQGGGAFQLLDQFGLGENEPDQKRLLLARGAERRGGIFGPVNHY